MTTLTMVSISRRQQQLQADIPTMATITEHGLFYTQQLGTPLRLAQVIGLTSTAFLAGIHSQQADHRTRMHQPADALLQARPSPTLSLRLLSSKLQLLFWSDSGPPNPRVTSFSPPVWSACRPQSSPTSPTALLAPPPPPPSSTRPPPPSSSPRFHTHFSRSSPSTRSCRRKPNPWPRLRSRMPLSKRT